MTELERVKIAQDAIMAYYSTDDPENKAYALSVNVCVLYKARILRTENHGDFAIFLGIADIIGSFRQNKVIWIIGNCLVMVDD